ncbi:MAG: hypothetical protein QOD07_1238, partial [Frankiaceae bacterium]|nr:hypothetical protein [Frankiaceae bacterium]
GIDVNEHGESAYDWGSGVSTGGTLVGAHSGSISLGARPAEVQA